MKPRNPETRNLETRNLETLKPKKVFRGETVDPDPDSDPDPDLDETQKP